MLNTLILENTPEGLILLRYNQEDNIFEYWTNGRIQYRNLENAYSSHKEIGDEILSKEINRNYGAKSKSKWAKVGHQ